MRGQGHHKDQEWLRKCCHQFLLCLSDGRCWDGQVLIKYLVNDKFYEKFINSKILSLTSMHLVLAHRVAHIVDFHLFRPVRIKLMYFDSNFYKIFDIIGLVDLTKTSAPKQAN